MAINRAMVGVDDVTLEAHLTTYMDLAKLRLTARRADGENDVNVLEPIHDVGLRVHNGAHLGTYGARIIKAKHSTRVGFEEIILLVNHRDNLLSADEPLRFLARVVPEAYSLGGDRRIASWRCTSAIAVLEDDLLDTEVENLRLLRKAAS